MTAAADKNGRQQRLQKRDDSLAIKQSTKGARGEVTVVQEVSMQQPTRGQEVLAASGER